MLLASTADAATTSAKRATVDAKPMAMPPPAYPRDALREGAAGKLTLLVSVDATGAASDVQLLGRGSGHAALDQAAIAAARQWRFVPAQKQGRAVPSRLKIPVTFESGMEPVDAPAGMANASKYLWYLLDAETGDTREHTCDIVYSNVQGPTQRLYCGLAVKTAKR